MSKDSKKDSKLPLIAGAVVGGLAAAGAYKYLKGSVLPGTSPLSIEAKHSGKFTFVDADAFVSKNKTIKENFKAIGAYLGHHLNNTGIKLVNPDNPINKNKKFEGHVYLAGTEAKNSGIKGTVTINDTSKDLNILNTDIKSGIDSAELDAWKIPTEHFLDILKKNGKKREHFKHKDAAGVQKILKEINLTSGFIKPNNSYDKKGLYSSLSELTSGDVTDPKISKKLLELRDNPHNLIVQPNLHPKQEIRVHTYNGRIVGNPVNRFRSGMNVEGTRTELPKTFDPYHFEQQVQRYMKRKKIKSDTLVGWDLAVTPNDKTYILEANTNSGFISSGSKRIINDITGVRPVNDVIHKTIATGVGVGAATYGLTKQSSNTDKSESNLIPVATLLGIGGAGGYFLSKRLGYPVESLLTKMNHKFQDMKWDTNYIKNKLKDSIFVKTSAAKKEKDSQVGGSVKATKLLIGGVGLGTVGGLAANKDIRHQMSVFKSIVTGGNSVGRVAIDPEEASKLKIHTDFENIDDIPDNDSLGKYLRQNKNRPVFGDDSELIIVGQHKNVPYVQNVAGSYKNVDTVKGNNYSITNDPTTGGLEINMKPGNADELHRRVRRSVREGIPKAININLKDRQVTNLALIDISKDGDFPHSVGASSHLHYQAPVADFDRRSKALIGALTPLNYVVPGGDKRHGGYSSRHSRTTTFGDGLPGLQIWANSDDADLLKSIKVPSAATEKPRAWTPEKGNVAGEMRFMNPMHSHPNLSKKYFELSELALGDSAIVDDLAALGDKILKSNTSAKSLHKTKNKTAILSEYEQIIKKHKVLSEDTGLQWLVSSAKGNKKMKAFDVVKAWTKF